MSCRENPLSIYEGTTTEVCFLGRGQNMVFNCQTGMVLNDAFVDELPPYQKIQKIQKIQKLQKIQKHRKLYLAFLTKQESVLFLRLSCKLTCHRQGICLRSCHASVQPLHRELPTGPTEHP